MVKAIWAVACPVILMMSLVLSCGGCAGARGASGGTAPADASLPSAGGVAESSGHSRTASAVPMVQPADRIAKGQDAALAYRIGAEDILRISVWENTQLTLDVVVRPDGKISFPLVQDVQAEGLSAVELADVIHQRLLAFIKDPQVSVIVTQVNAPKIFILGNVARPGPYPLRSDTSVLQALSMAGGFTQFASPRSIKLVRGTGARQEVRKVNYYDLIVSGGDGNYLLMPGDTIVVP